MFYTTGIDITNDKQMFNFLKNHFTYHTMNSWNCSQSIANNVKLYKLGLKGDWCTAFNLLESGEYDTLNWIIKDWEREKLHLGYTVGFNGRSGGYLVLYSDHDYGNILPDAITESDDYEQYKEYCKEYYGSVKANRWELVKFTKLVRDFDELCDILRAYVDELSQLKFEVVEMEKAVEDFNSTYQDDLEYLGFKELVATEGKVDCSEIRQLTCLWEAFIETAKRPNSGYTLMCNDDGIAYYEDN